MYAKSYTSGNHDEHLKACNSSAPLSSTTYSVAHFGLKNNGLQFDNIIYTYTHMHARTVAHTHVPYLSEQKQGSYKRRGSAL